MVHLPLGALAVAPILLIAAMLIPKLSKGFAWSGMLIIAIGTLGTVLAVATGDAASDAPAFGIPPAAEAVLENHEELGEATRTIFLVLAATLFIGLGVWTALGKRVKRWMFCAGMGVYLLAYSLGMLALANTGHEGGRLVHEFGVRAQISASATSGGALSPQSPPRRDHDDD
jgi:uncharacterized membrane protein